jgi:hypothetical protein
MKKNCKHPSENVVHVYEKDSALGDSYWCGLCDELLQVG